ncbi:hypothetical protein T11_9434 [Trichinella zimbabwensis]|uniref:Uncharacterized protein n=1 Tax=Trichinella zimbabwensis TaxID=268475 RepID=A0A0V1GKZ7_9BILA|nr:hypothetical protein T11_9434 [Trichinella zimbabwensis]
MRFAYVALIKMVVDVRCEVQRLMMYCDVRVGINDPR